SNDISKTISGLVEARDHEGLCYTTNSSATCPSSGTGITTYCETYGWTVLWRHENHPESYSCTIGGSECIPNVTSSTMRVAVEAHDVSHNFIGFACSSSFSVDSDNYGKTLSVTWPAPSTPSTPSSGGGGGGGGAALAPNKTIVVEEIKKIIETIEPGENKIIPIETVSVKEISITAKNKISNMEINVKQVETLPENITKPINHVFSYFEINTLNVSKEDIENVSITFKVNVSLANENNIDKESIILNRFEEGNWTPLETSFISEENGEYIYKTLIGGFSLFAISGKEKLESSYILGKIKKIAKIILIPILIIIIIITILVLFLKFKKTNYVETYNKKDK
ncbi:MAG: PGF-pre-PGF domain-containing protein, partial [Nanoarchaeota archaeon]|nr:PGF-pre-PGF domain-containing protein [Nanoarchaeota archaeon]